MPPKSTEIVHIASKPAFRKKDQKSLTNTKKKKKTKKRDGLMMLKAHYEKEV